ncbi:uncharacterized protein LOC129300539 [Prosopis cineraria]|uniref:uncharacterized protein LOC129300539 n=1 Tax=Prosopis cineraria TaxID=364024 RepID=UPI00240ED400|nr:uncharacterized protein LOC129300539 [Prosopis cineraria]
MQSIFNLRASYGVPLCLSGITLTVHASLPQEITDHDRRREIIRLRRHGSLNTHPLHAIQEMGSLTNFVGIKHDEHGDLDDAILLDLFQAYTAKAA